MANTNSERDGNPNLEFWWVVAQWICQQRALYGTPDQRKDHINNPGEDNEPCDSCYHEAYRVAEHFKELLRTCCHVAYMSGSNGLPDHEAGPRVLGAIINRARDMEGAKVLLAQVVQNWWELPREEPDERWFFGEGEDQGAFKD